MALKETFTLRVSKLRTRNLTKGRGKGLSWFEVITAGR